MNYMSNQAIFEGPRSQEEMNMMLAREIQDYQLTHPEESLRQWREAERDLRKSNLRREEAENRALLRMRAKEIYCAEDTIQLIVRVADGREVSRKTAFRFGMSDLEAKRFMREGEKGYLLALILKTKEKEITRLYPAEYASSPLKLRTHTFLGEYEDSLTDEERRFCWAWLQKKINAEYQDDIDNIIPSQAGFFQGEGRICFWMNREGLEPFMNETIEKFSFNISHDLNPNKIIEALAEMEENFGMNDMELGSLLVVRLYTLLSNLATEAPPSLGIVLAGEDSVEIGRRFLRVLDSGESGSDFFNFDSDRISIIRKNIKKLKNTPAFFVSSGSCSKSFWNRAHDVFSWLANGWIEGSRLAVPIIFCVKEIPADWPLDNLVVMQFGKLWLHEGWDIFDKLQGHVIDTVEKSGRYWAEALKRHFKEQEKENYKDSSLLNLIRAIKEVVLQILDLHGKAGEYFSNLLNAGIDEIASQISMTNGYLLDKFRLGLCHEVELGGFSVYQVGDFTGIERLDGKIFFDGDYYMLTNSTLCNICETLGYEKKAALYIKRDLASQGYLKQYKGSGMRPKEYEIDLTLGVSGEKTKVSVLAIKKSFWDEAGEVALFERGEN